MQVQPSQLQSSSRQVVDNKNVCTPCRHPVYTLFALLSHWASGSKHASGERVAWVFRQVPLFGALRGQTPCACVANSDSERVQCPVAARRGCAGEYLKPLSLTLANCVAREVLVRRISQRGNPRSVAMCKFAARFSSATQMRLFGAAKFGLMCTCSLQAWRKVEGLA